MAKRKKTGGRVKGSQNKIPAEMKVTIQNVFRRLGDEDGFLEWGRINKTDFYTIWAKLIPKNIDVSGEITHRVINVVRSFPEGTDGAS